MNPNILIFHCHDLGQHLGCYGVPTVNTPNIDRLAAEGVRFDQSFCTAPQCSPSRASLFTGRYPHENGVMGLTHKRFAWDLHSTEKHLAGLLSEAGYRTAAIGVVHETHTPVENWGYEEGYGGGRAVTVADNTIKLLRERASDQEPFYISAGTIEPHRISKEDEHGYYGFVGDHIQPDTSKGVHVPGYLKDDEGTREELAEIQGAVQHMDEQFGRVMEELDNLGLRDNTLVVFTSDHGLALPRAKCTCYDPGIEVPLLLRLPAREGWHGGHVKSEMITNIDVLPTLCDLVDVTPPDNVRGRSFAPLLDGESYTPNGAVFAEMTYHEYYDPIRMIRTESHKLLAFFAAAPAFMDCSQSWWPRSSPRVPEEPGLAYHPNIELYDLNADPWEQNNVADDPNYDKVKGDLLRRLREHLEATDDPILKGALTPPIHHTVMEMLNEA